MNLPIIFRFFSLIFRFHPFCMRANSTDHRPIIWNYRPIIVRFFSGNRPIWAAGNRLIPVPEDVFCSPNLNRSSPNLDLSSLNLGASSPNLNPANRIHKMDFAEKWIESISLAVSRRGQGRNTCYVLAHPPLGGSHV